MVMMRVRAAWQSARRVRILISYVPVITETLTLTSMMPVIVLFTSLRQWSKAKKHSVRYLSDGLRLRTARNEDQRPEQLISHRSLCLCGDAGCADTCAPGKSHPKYAPFVRLRRRGLSVLSSVFKKACSFETYTVFMPANAFPAAKERMEQGARL